MSFDLDDRLKKIQEKIKSRRTFLELSKDYDKLEKKVGSNLDPKASNITSSLSNKKGFLKNNFKENNQYDNLINLIQFNKGSGNSTINYIKDKLSQIIFNIQPKLSEIIYEESIKALGCSQEQTYPDGNEIFIKIKSVDLFSLLKKDPLSPVGRMLYEPLPPVANSIPFSTNWELYNRIQNQNIPISYVGRSGQELFSISYVNEDDQGNQGDFFKIVLNQRQGKNLVSKFIVDYYESISLSDRTSTIANIVNLITGSVDIQSGVSSIDVNNKNKFNKIIQRILGLCFDSTEEIDVGGVSKIAETETIDDSFFILNDIDLRDLDFQISNLKRGVVSFEDCDNVDLPVNFTQINENIVKINNINNQTDFIEQVDEILNSISESNNWKFVIPNIDIKIKTEFIRNIPNAFAFSILTPKVLLPIFIMTRALHQNVIDDDDILNVIKNNKRLIIGIVSRVSAIFIEELFNIIKQDILSLIQSISGSISKELSAKKYSVILRLVDIIVSITSLITDYRKCRNVLDDIINILDIISGLSNSRIPTFVLPAAQLLPGFSDTRAMINVIEEFQKLGIPTGDLPDGSPNINLIAKLAEIKGISRERNENEKVQVFLPPLTITPLGVTLPISTFGKSI